jgi:hypothetical protein
MKFNEGIIDKFPSPISCFLTWPATIVRGTPNPGPRPLCSLRRSKQTRQHWARLRPLGRQMDSLLDVKAFSRGKSRSSRAKQSRNHGKRELKVLAPNHGIGENPHEEELEERQTDSEESEDEQARSRGADLQQLLSEAEHFYGKAYYRNLAMQVSLVPY